jgi:two-component system, NarL family, sensor histidine kinase UhpB
MKSWFDPARWGIASRLLVLALLPTVLMLVAGNASMYWLSLRDAATEVRERGRSVAAALAEGSRYAVVSGNTASVDRTVRDLMAADPSLVAVTVLDGRRSAVIEVESQRPHSTSADFEVPINAEPLNVDTFDAAGSARTVDRRAGPPLGFVRVRMTTDPIVAASVERLAKGSALVLLATIASLGIALMLAVKLREPLKDVMRALRQLRDRNYDVRMRPGATGELAELQSAVTELAKGLRITHEQLEAEVAARTADLSEAMEHLRVSDEERGRLIARGNELVEDERRRISTEIHDDLNAVLVSVRLDAEALASLAAENGQPETRAAALRIVQQVGTIYERARAILRKLRPEIIDALGLAGAVEETVRAFAEADRKCKFQLEVEPLPGLPEPTAIAAYRMLQEALSNVVKHAGASHCRVTLRPAGTDRVTLIVEDDGRGFSSSPNSAGGLGLVGMRERAKALRGSFEVESVPGRGTRLTITLPVSPP